jgi:CRISPR-associated protein Cas2
MPRAATYLVCYDVTSDDERQRVAKSLEGFGLRIQRSVFECRLTRTSLGALRTRLESLAPTTGSVVILRMDDRARRYAFGQPHAAENLSSRTGHALLV